MPRRSVLMMLLLLILTPTVLESQSGSLSARVNQYEMATFPVEIDPALYGSPFDSADIDLIGIFTSPSGEQITVPGFWMQPYVDVCDAPCLLEDWQPAGEGGWQVRFTPNEAGAWAGLLQVRDDGAVVDEQSVQFDVQPSDAPGFIRVGANRRYFRFDNGAAYFPVGHNLNWSWAGGGGVHAYARWFESLHRAGGNYARIIVDVPWFIGLEWSSVGSYRQDDAARLDAILELAAEYDIAVQLVLLWHQGLMTYNGPPVLVPEEPARPDVSADWDNNPYGAAFGGPLSGPGVYFFDNTALRLFRQRLRYIVARYGHSPQIFAWEIIDQIDRTANYSPDVADRWLRDMAGYLREIDPYKHLITAGSREYTDVIGANPLLDFTTAQFFQRLPIEATTPHEPSIISLIQRNRQMSNAPTLISSHSLNPWFEPTVTDPDGIHMQNALWAAALAGAAGGAVSAWGETYAIPQELERYYAPLTAFAAGIDWANLDLQPAEAGLLVADRALYRSVRLTDFNRQIRAPLSEPRIHVISADGISPDPRTIPSYLYGLVYDNRFNQPMHYRVVTPVNTYFEVGIRAVSAQAGARLIIALNEDVAAEFALQSGSTDASVRIPLPVGEHQVTLNNSGEDWLEIDYIEIGQLIAPARVLTLRDSEAGVVLAWLQHRAYTWEMAAEPAEPVQMRYRLDNLPPGRYLAQVWLPGSGAVVGEEVVIVGEDRVFLLDLIPMNSQLALRAFRLPDDVDADSTLPTGDVTDDLSSLLTRVPRSED